MAVPSYDELLSTYGVQSYEMKQALEDNHVTKFSFKLDRWEKLARSLELPIPDIERLKREGDYEEQKDKMLESWKQRCGSQATYEVLTRALLQINRTDMAEEVVKLRLSLRDRDHMSAAATSQTTFSTESSLATPLLPASSSGVEDISPTSPTSWITATSVQPAVDIASTLQQLEVDFHELVKEVEVILSKNSVVLKTITRRFSMLPQSVKRWYQTDKHYRRTKRKILKSTTIKTLFDNLTDLKHWNFMMPDTLDHILQDVKIDDIHQKIDKYKEKLSNFKMKTKLRDLIGTKFPVPDYCVELTMEVEGWEDKTIKEAEQAVRNTTRCTVYGQHVPLGWKEVEPESTENEYTRKSHILNKFELQVLSNLLDVYSSEKIKEIQQSIQKKQGGEGGDISREEVERLLQEIGMTTLAKDLKQALQKGVESEQHYEEYKTALKEAKVLPLRYLKILFFGPPRSGKSTMRRRLVQEILNLISLGHLSASTGVAEAHEIIIKKMTSEATAISDSQWHTLQKSDEKKGRDITYLAQILYRLIRGLITKSPSIAHPSSEAIKQLSDSDTSHDKHASSPVKPQGETNHEEHAETGSEAGSKASSGEGSNSEEDTYHFNNFEMKDINEAFNTLDTILKSDSQEELHLLLGLQILINMVDVGGQPEFLDMLPVLTVGAALYLLFFRLDQELEKRHPVKFLAPGSVTERTLDESSYCIEEVIHQALASIACFSGHSSEGKADCASSHAILVGTHKDRVSASDIEHKEKAIREKFIDAEMYKDLLLITEEGKPFFTVDNMHGTDESEMNAIRGNIERIVKKHFTEIPIPASWLMFRVVLNLLNEPVVSLSLCEEIARRLSMPTPVQEALWFFHHHVGSLLYYPDIPSMKDTVLCTPQVIFDSISTVIIKNFQYSNYHIARKDVEMFKQTGIFSLSDISKTTEHHRNSHLSPHQLVDVLKHQSILAEVKHDAAAKVKRDAAEIPAKVKHDADEIPVKVKHDADEIPVKVKHDADEIPAKVKHDADEIPVKVKHDADETVSTEQKFIIPAILKNASEEELNPSPSLEASPLMIHIEGGFVPFGLFSASIAHMIAHIDSMSPKWKLYTKEVRKNKVRFLVAGAYNVTLISRPQYLEIQTERYGKQARCGYSLKNICSAIRDTIVETLETTISKMKMKYRPQARTAATLTSQRPFDLAFTCCLKDPQPHGNHLMKVCKDETGYYGECLKDGVSVFLEEKHNFWIELNAQTEATATPESSATSISSGNLNIDDLSIVLNSIWDARSKWYNIGLAVGISANTLDAVETKLRGDCEDCLRDMLKEWLRGGHRPPTWSALSNAIESPSVGHGDLAKAIICRQRRKRGAPALDDEDSSESKIRKH